MTSPNAALKLKRSEAKTLGAVTTTQKCPQPEPKLRMNVADNGISTSRERYTMVYPKVSPKPGITQRVDAGRRRRAPAVGVDACWGVRDGARLLTIDAIESPVVGEVSGLSLRPTTECAVDGHQRDGGKLLCILRRDIGIAGAIKMFGGNFLAFLGVQVTQILLGDLARTMLVHNLIDDAHGRLRQDAQRGYYHVELVRPQLLHGQIGLVLPSQQHIADTPFHERHRSSARAGIENRHIFVQLLHESLGRGVAAAGLLQGPRPRGQIVPAGSARGLGAGSDDGYARAHEIAPIMDVLRIAL